MRTTINYPFSHKKTEDANHGNSLGAMAKAATEQKRPPPGSRDVPPPTNRIQVSKTSKYSSGERKSNNNCIKTARQLGINIELPVQIARSEYNNAHSKSNDKAKEEELDPNAPRPLTSEELKVHMIYLPPAGTITDIRAMDQSEVDKLALLINTKSQNQLVNESLETTALIMFKKLFMIRGDKCSIIEVEFYFGDDPYHTFDPKLNQSHRFYFRQRLAEINDDPSRIHPDGAVFCTDSNRGLCISMGAVDFQCAILIRSILTPNGVIEGADRVVDFIMAKFQVNSVDQLNQVLIERLLVNNQKAIAEGKQPIELSHGLLPSYHGGIELAVLDADTAECPYHGERIYRGPRVGLNLSKEVEYYGKYSMFVVKPYRFTYRGDLLKVAKHGLALTARLAEIPDLTIQKELKVPGESIGRWSTYFMQGETAAIDILMQPENANMDDVKKQCTAYGFFSRFNK